MAAPEPTGHFQINNSVEVAVACKVCGMDCERQQRASRGENACTCTSGAPALAAPSSRRYVSPGRRALKPQATLARGWCGMQPMDGHTLDHDNATWTLG